MTITFRPPPLLHPKEQSVLGLLLEHEGQAVNWDLLEEIPGITRINACTFVHRIKAELKHLNSGYSISTVHRKGFRLTRGEAPKP